MRKKIQLRQDTLDCRRRQRGLSGHRDFPPPSSLRTMVYTLHSSEVSAELDGVGVLRWRRVSCRQVKVVVVINLSFRSSIEEYRSIHLCTITSSTSDFLSVTLTLI